MIPGIPATVPHGPYDKDPNFVPSFDDADEHADIWEDEKGVYSNYAPEALLLTEPDLWVPYTDWCLGKHELTERDLRKRSNFYCEAIATLTSASHRASIRPREDKPKTEEATEL